MNQLRVKSPFAFGVLIAIQALSGHAFAQAAPAVPAPAAAPVAVNAPDIVRLKNGGILRGLISELVPGQYVTIVLITGETRKIPFAEVQQAGIANEPANAAPVAPAPAPAPVPVPVPAPAAQGSSPASNPQPFAVVHAAEARVSVVSHPNGSTLFRRAASAGFNGQGTVSGYDEVCTAPCNVSMPAGTHTFAVAKPGGKPHEADAVNLLPGDATMTVSIVDRTIMRLGMGVIGVGALVGGFVMILSGSSSGHSLSSDQVIGAALLAGLGAGAVGLAFGIKDGAQVTVTPGAAPAPATKTADNASAPWLNERHRDASALRDQLSGLTLTAHF